MSISREDWEELRRLEEEGDPADLRDYSAAVTINAECEKVASAIAEPLATFSDSDGHVWSILGPWPLLPTYYEVERDDGFRSLRAAGLVIPLLGVDPDGEER